MDHTRIGRDLGEGECRFRSGEINDRLRALHRLCRVIGHDHANGSAAHSNADILTDPRMSGTFYRTRQMHPVAGRNLPNQHLAHAARSPCNHYAGCIAHVMLLIRFRFSAW